MRSYVISHEALGRECVVVARLRFKTSKPQGNRSPVHGLTVVGKCLKGHESQLYDLNPSDLLWGRTNPNISSVEVRIRCQFSWFGRLLSRGESPV